MRLVNYARELDRAQMAYNNRCEAIAEAIRQQLVIPFCRKHRLVFSAGMGTFCFFGIDTKKQVDRFDLERMPGTKRLLAALDLNVDGNNSLGTSYVYDVRKEDL